MLLALDIGNTNIEVGVFEQQRLKKSWKVRSEKEKTCDEYAVTLLNLFHLAGLQASDINSIILASVVPPLTPVFEELSQSVFRVKPLVVGPGLKTGMPILYENPLEVGADRVVASLAAFTKYGGPAIVVDFGTATTFDAVSANGEYLGGAIAPGILIAAEALYLRTAKLPRIEIKKPKKAIGRSTVSSMHSGLYFGYIGLVRGLVERIKQELGGEAKVIATGGLALILADEVEVINFHDPDLVLQGLRIIYERNRE